MKLDLHTSNKTKVKLNSEEAIFGVKWGQMPSQNHPESMKRTKNGPKVDQNWKHRTKTSPDRSGEASTLIFFRPNG